MNNFEYYIPTTINLGEGQIKKLETLSESGKRLLIIYGGGSIKSCNNLYYDAIDILKAAGLEIWELSGVKNNPRIETVRKGVDICRKENIDMVLAIGGGSSIDTAKLVAAGALYEGDPWNLILDSGKIHGALPIYVISTIAATGSEMSPWAVISDTSKNEKRSTGSKWLWPKMSILDPKYTYSVPRRFAAAGIADIMSHIFENYFTNVEGTAIQRNLCEALLKTVIECGPAAIERPDDYDAKSNLMWCSCLAMNGLLEYGAAVAWGVHGMEHELSAYYDIVHGEGLAILTPVWMRYVAENDSSKIPHFARYGRSVWRITDMDDGATAEEAIRKTEEFLFDVLKLPRNLKEVGIMDESRFHDMAVNCASRFQTAFSFIPVDGIEELLRRAL